MLGKINMKAVLFGFLGGAVGGIAALLIFFVNSLLLFGWWGSPRFFPIQIFLIGTTMSFLVLILSFLLRLKRFGILVSILFFLLFYIATLMVCKMPKLPIMADEAPLFYRTVLTVPFLVWLMFLLGGVKLGNFLAKKK